MITEKIADYYESYTTEQNCYETICELVPETTTTSDFSSTESWNLDTSDGFETDEMYDTTTDIATYDTTFMEFDNSTNSNLFDNGTHFSRETLANYISNMTEADQLNLRRLCWETMFGQELVKLTVMDLVRDGNITKQIEFRTVWCAFPYRWPQSHQQYLWIFSEHCSLDSLTNVGVGIWKNDFRR